MKKDLKNNPVDNEILSKGKDIVKDFDDSKEVYVEPKSLTNRLFDLDMDKKFERVDYLETDTGSNHQKLQRQGGIKKAS